MIIEPRAVQLTPRSGISVRRTVPTRQVRTIGAWCFLDHFGPSADGGMMTIGAHPHVGLQTVTWLFSGQVEHRDSVGSIQVITPGELNLMTSGEGIAHSELAEPPEPLHGVQLWVALPDTARHQAPHFEHHRDLPEFEHDGARIRVFMGSLLGHDSPASTYSPLVGAHVTLSEATVSIPRPQGFQIGILPADHDVSINGKHVPATHLFVLDEDEGSITITGQPGSNVMLLGGEPFTEPTVMWWNFIGRTHDEVRQMREDWANNNTTRFAAFDDRINSRVPAPEMPNVPLKAR